MALGEPPTPLPPMPKPPSPRPPWDVMLPTDPPVLLAVAAALAAASALADAGAGEGAGGGVVPVAMAAEQNVAALSSARVRDFMVAPKMLSKSPESVGRD